MPITKSAKKALRQNLKRRKINLLWKRKIKNLRKEILRMIAEKKIEEAKKKISTFYKTVDKAAKRGTIKKNKASRLKSRLSLKISQLSKTNNSKES